MGAPKPAQEARAQEAPAPKILALFARGLSGPESRTAFGVHILGGRKGAYTSQYIYGELDAGRPFGVIAGNGLCQKASGPVIPNTEQRAEFLATVRAVWWAANQPETPSTVALCIRSRHWRPDGQASFGKAFFREPDLAEAFNAALDVLNSRAIRLVAVTIEERSEEGITQRLQKNADEVFSNPRGDTVFLTDAAGL